MHYIILCAESGPVLNLIAIGTTDTTVFNVTWLPPMQPNGMILHYIVEIYSIGDNCGKVLTRVNRSEVSHQATSQMISTTTGGLGTNINVD